MKWHDMRMVSVRRHKFDKGQKLSLAQDNDQGLTRDDSPLSYRSCAT